MKKILAVLLSLALFASLASAQPRAIGFRAGGTGDLSYQHSTDTKEFLQADLGINYLKYPGGLLNVTYNFILADVKQFYFFVGPGAHTGFYNFKVYDAPTSETPERYTINTKFVLGITAQLGVEFDFKKIPLNLSVEYRPTWSILGNVFDPSSICLGVRYRLF